LVSKMSDIFAWTVDFFSVQKNDKFKVIYEERYADGEFIGIGEIKAAVFGHFDTKFYAFNYQHEKMEFDEKTLREHEENTKVKNIEAIELGRYEIETWYYSPLPKEYENCKVGISFRCDLNSEFDSLEVVLL